MPPQDGAPLTCVTDMSTYWRASIVRPSFLASNVEAAEVYKKEPRGVSVKQDVIRGAKNLGNYAPQATKANRRESTWKVREKDSKWTNMSRKRLLNGDRSAGVSLRSNLVGRVA